MSVLPCLVSILLTPRSRPPIGVDTKGGAASGPTTPSRSRQQNDPVSFPVRCSASVVPVRASRPPLPVDQRRR